MSKTSGERPRFVAGEPIAPKRFIRPYGLFYIYRSHLRFHKTQELFAGLGIVIGVALVFATLTANGSIAGSAAQVLHKLVGRADLQLRARGPEGFSEGLLASVERLPGVKQAAPLLEVPATIVTSDGRKLTVTVLGADAALGIMDGLAHTVPGAVFSERAVALSAASAQALRISPAAVEGVVPEHVTIKLRGQAFALKVSAVLGKETAGALSSVLAAAMPLEDLQALAGLKGRVSRILVQSAPGQRAAVQKELERVAAGRISVAPADQDIALLDQALKPGDLASTFFAAVAALLGFLFAFNAVLLTVPERRAQIAELRLDGARKSAMVQLLLFQAACLGLVASLIGLGIGYALSVAVFRQRPGYLAEAFVLGGGIVIGMGPVLLAVIGGVIATCLASLVPAADLRRGRAMDAVFREGGQTGNALSRTLGLRLTPAAVVLLALATAILLTNPTLALVACIAVAIAVVLAMPLAFIAVVDRAERTAKRHRRLTVLPVAVMALRRTTLRSLALAMTGAVALFGAVALSGARGDLFSALERLGDANTAAGQIWIINSGDVTATNTFVPDHPAASIEKVPGVASVFALQGGFLDLGDRRVAIFGRPGDTFRKQLRTQIIAGNLARAERELRQGGWIAVSLQLAADYHAVLGGTFNIPSPTGVARFRVAALITNLAWPGGALLMNSTDADRLRGTDNPTALLVRLAPGADAKLTQHRITRLLGPNSGLEVLTARAWLDRGLSLVGEGLGQLKWISVMLVVAAILAMGAALSADLWLQRPWFADLRLDRVPDYRLRRIMLMKCALMLSAGCIMGSLAGIYGQVILDAYLKHVTGFPVIMLASGRQPLETFVIVVAAALALAAVPIWLVSRAPLVLGLENA